MVIVAQLVRASDCGSEGRGFETRLSPRNQKPPVKEAFFVYVRLIFLFLVNNQSGTLLSVRFYALRF